MIGHKIIEVRLLKVKSIVLTALKIIRIKMIAMKKIDRFLKLKKMKTKTKIGLKIFKRAQNNLIVQMDYFFLAVAQSNEIEL